jgi:hypothetical protein
MKNIAIRIWNEPALATGVPTVILASAAGIWENQFLAFGAAAFAAVGALFTRQNVTGPNKPLK